jgi:replicative DNA helicase
VSRSLVVPHDEQMEAAVLGSVLLTSAALPPLVSVDGLRAEHFYRPRHRLVYDAMLALLQRAEPVDTLTVVAELRSAGKLRDAGGDRFVHALPAVVPAVGAVRDYARRVLDLARLRVQFDAGRELMEAAAAGDRERVARAEGKLASAAAEVARRRSRQERQEAVLEIVDRQGGTKWTTPFPKLNELLAGGLRPGQFTVIPGWTGHGKSVLTAQLLAHAARQGARCALYTNEMEAEELDLRSVARESGISHWRLVQGRLRQGEHERFLEAVKRLGEDFELVEAAGMTAEEIAYDIRRERWDVAAVDLLNGLPGSSEVKDIDNNVGVLAACSRQARSHVLACQHLNQTRAVGKDYPPEPVAADIRGSGAIRNLANNVLFVYIRESEVEGEQGLPGTTAILKLDKARGALPGKLEVTFQPKRMRFLPPLETARAAA